MPNISVTEKIRKLDLTARSRNIIFHFPPEFARQNVSEPFILSFRPNKKNQARRANESVATLLAFERAILVIRSKERYESRGEEGEVVGGENRGTARQCKRERGTSWNELEDFILIFRLFSSGSECPSEGLIHGAVAARLGLKYRRIKAPVTFIACLKLPSSGYIWRGARAS